MKSIINQTYKNIEVICVNDASTDLSLNVLNKMASSDKRIKVISKKNEGVSLARNIALSIATGEYLMFVDADDWIAPRTCEIALSTAIKNNADVVFWNYMSEYLGTSRQKELFSQEFIIFDNCQVKNQLHRRLIGIVDSELAAPEKMDTFCPIWGKLYRTELIRNNHIFFPDIRKIGTYEDGMFNLFLFNHVNRAIYINKYLYHYRKTNQNSITQTFDSSIFQKWDCLFSMMEEYITNNHLGSIYYKALNNRIALGILGLGLSVISSDMSFTAKTKIIKNCINTKRYRSAYNNLTLKYFPVHWKLFYWLAKSGNATALTIMLMIINRLRFRKVL